MSDSAGFSTYEMRRRAPLHFQARADNARFSAYTLWRADNGEGPDASAVGYSGDTKIALKEAFLREASVALELIVKAVIAKRIELVAGVERIPPIHDIPRLWRDAQLPEICDQDKGRLLLAKSVLEWSGRYPAPNKSKDDKAWAEELEIFEYYDVVPEVKGITLRRPFSFTWDDFDRLYRVASAEFQSLQSTYLR